MNKFNALAFAAITLVASTSALADGGTGPGFGNNWVRQASTSTLTRAEVQVELQRAKNAGELQFHNVSLAGFPKDLSTSTLTRAEVLAEYERAKNAGEIEFHSASLSTIAKGVHGTRSADDMASLDGGFGAAQLQRATR
jgi:hypothetical protein